jgi:hypothetical protein
MEMWTQLKKLMGEDERKIINLYLNYEGFEVSAAENDELSLHVFLPEVIY